MNTLENGFVKCRKENEYGFFIVGNIYQVKDGFIQTSSDGDITNFGNVRKFFGFAKQPSEHPPVQIYSA